MVRLPTIGSDDGVWGSLLNQFLQTIHTADGTLKDDVVNESSLAPTVRTKLNTASSGVASVNNRSGTVTLTKNDVGLSAVDNTSDASKPISSAVQAALNLKADTVNVGARVLLIDNVAALPAGTPSGVIVVVKA